MKALRIAVACSLTALLGACGSQYSAGSNAGQFSTRISSDSAPVSVLSSAAVEGQGYVPALGLTRCDADVASLEGGFWPSDGLLTRCDYRLTGEACEEDQVCAAAELAETHSFTGHGMR
jgi:hypothetical protein